MALTMFAGKGHNPSIVTVMEKLAQNKGKIAKKIR